MHRTKITNHKINFWKHNVKTIEWFYPALHGKVIIWVTVRIFNSLEKYTMRIIYQMLISATYFLPIPTYWIIEISFGKDRNLPWVQLTNLVNRHHRNKIDKSETEFWILILPGWATNSARLSWWHALWQMTVQLWVHVSVPFTFKSRLRMMFSTLDVLIHLGHDTFNIWWI